MVISLPQNGDFTNKNGDLTSRDGAVNSTGVPDRNGQNLGRFSNGSPI